MRSVALTVSLTLSMSCPFAAAAQDLTPTAQQSAMMRDAHCTLTQMVSAPIYEAEGRYVQGQLDECSQDTPWLDVSVGAAAPKPGEKLIFVYGRFLLGQRYNVYQPLMFQRGRPNTDYPIRDDVQQSVTLSGTKPNGSYSWKNAKMVLPFMPTEVHDQGDIGGGIHWYAYGGLEFVPGHERDAYPLNADSIVVGIDGISFNAPRAFSTPLEYPPPGQHYVEVIYFQHGDENGTFHRAYIPLFAKSQVPQWDAMVDSNPFFQTNLSAVVGTAIKLLPLMGAFAAVYNSPLGQQMREDYEECEHSIRPATMIC